MKKPSYIKLFIISLLFIWLFVGTKNTSLCLGNVQEFNNDERLASSGFVVYGSDQGASCSQEIGSEGVLALKSRNYPSKFLKIISPTIQPNQQLSGLKIILRATREVDKNEVVREAFRRAAAKWESLIKTPALIVIDVDFGPTRFGDPYPERVLGSTDPVVKPVPYAQIRNSLIAGAFNNPDLPLYEALPVSVVPTDIGNGTVMALPISLLRAIGLANPIANQFGGQFDTPSIGFNSAFKYDFNQNGIIDKDSIDFDAVVVHEIGHVLGFQSDVGFREIFKNRPVAPSVWDLFRFSPGVKLSEFTTTPRLLASGNGRHIFFDGVNEIDLSTSRPDRVGGDERQASHWQDDVFGGKYIGIMDPTLPFGTRGRITENDKRAIDLFGYRLNNQTAGDDVPPSVQITFPSGGETLFAGDTVPITWTAADNAAIMRQDIDILSDDFSIPASASSIVVGLSGDVRSFNWKIPKFISTKARVQVIALDASILGGKGRSPSTFNISSPLSPPIDLVSKLSGSKVELSWAAPKINPLDSVLLKGYSIYRSTTSPVTLIEPNKVISLNNSTTKFIDQPKPADGKIKYFYAVTAGYNVGESFLSPEVFSIPEKELDKIAPEVKVLFPNGGEVIDAASLINITWNSKDNEGITSQDIALSNDGGNTFNITIATGLSGNIQNFEFKSLSDTSSSTVRIQITVIDAAGNKVSDASDSNFAIKVKDIIPPTVKIISPSGEEKVKVGSILKINWEGSDNVGITFQQILLSIDDGKSFPITLLNDLDGVARSFNFIPGKDQKTNNARIQIIVRDSAGNETVSEKSSSFKIKAKK